VSEPGGFGDGTARSSTEGCAAPSTGFFGSVITISFRLVFLGRAEESVSCGSWLSADGGDPVQGSRSSGLLGFCVLTAPAPPGCNPVGAGPGPVSEAHGPYSTGAFPPDPGAHFCRSAPVFGRQHPAPSKLLLRRPLQNEVVDDRTVKKQDAVESVYLSPDGKAVMVSLAHNSRVRPVRSWRSASLS
jgi:hypothetical protein